MFNTNNTKFFCLPFFARRNGQAISERGGVSLYLAIVIMTILLAIALGISAISISQIKLMKEIGDSVIAFYAADTGIEEALYNLYQEKTSNCDKKNLPFKCETIFGNISYSVQGIEPGSLAGSFSCPKPPIDYYCLKSIGTYTRGTKSAEKIKRSIEVFY